MSHRYHNPVAIRLGAGVLDELPAVLAGRRCILVTFPEAESLGLVARLRRILGPQLAGVEDRIEPNPDVAYLAAMYARFWHDHADCPAVVAVGGGSAIDTAKALMVGTANGRFDELIAPAGHGRGLHPAAGQGADRRTDDRRHRQRGHAVGHDLGSRRGQEALAAPARDLARGGARRPAAHADAAARR